jgi:hypothetical protein
MATRITSLLHFLKPEHEFRSNPTIGVVKRLVGFSRLLLLFIEVLRVGESFLQCLDKDFSIANFSGHPDLSELCTAP